MIKIALCDDSLQQLQEMQSLLQQYREQVHRSMRVMVCQRPAQLLAQLENYADTQIVFLDIVMPEMNGICLAQQIRERYPHIAIIFLTASAEYAVDSYSVQAENYLLKPLKTQVLFSCLDNTLKKIEKQASESLTISCKEGVCRIPLAQLVFCEVRNKTIFFHLANGKTIASQMVFAELLETLLRYPQFIKPHRSFALNLDYVDQISTKEVLLQNEITVPIAKGNANHVRQAFLSYYST